jgi:hypothetical protein
MAFTPRQSKANQIWLLTFALVILALAIETQPHPHTSPIVDKKGTTQDKGEQAP